jgi:hypothetical protein
MCYGCSRYTNTVPADFDSLIKNHDQVAAQMNSISFSGFEIGCVSPERFHKMCKMEKDIADGTELLKSIIKPASQWRKLLHMPVSKGTLLKR